MVGPAREPLRRGDRFAQGLLLALLGMVLGTMTVVLIDPRPCPAAVAGAPPSPGLTERADAEVSADEAPTDPGASVADDTWGSLGP